MTAGGAGGSRRAPVGSRAATASGAASASGGEPAHAGDVAAIPPDPLRLPLARSGLARPPILSRLRRIGVVTVGDLLFHLPRRYEDVREMRTLRWVALERPEEPVSVRATVTSVQAGQTYRRRVRVVTARLRDDEGGEGIAVWYGRRYVERRLSPGMRIVLTGKAAVKGLLGIPEFQGPEFGPDDPEALHAGRIVPVYRLTSGITNPGLRRIIRDALTRYAPAVGDYLPDEIRARRELAALPVALEHVHFPEDFTGRDAAVRRLAFDELLALQVGMLSRDRQRRPDTADRIVVADERFAEVRRGVERALTVAIRRRSLAVGGGDATPRSDPDAPAPPEPVRDPVPAPHGPVTLTADQLEAIVAIRRDLASTRPMLRLLQGDVGSGKTAVAAMALAFVADTGRQAVLLAPTDLLARQHRDTLAALLEPAGHAVTLLTGSLAPAERQRALAEIAGEAADGAGEAAAAAAQVALPFADQVVDRVPRTSRGLVLVGTHALLQEGVRFRDLALVVVDEQHRFGVEQREAIAGKGRNPHVLLMTATPIPQTLAQVFYADLDVSDLRTPPTGRIPVRTGIRPVEQLLGDDPADPQRGTWQLVARELAAGRRAFVIVPLVEDADGAEEVGEGVAVEQAATMVREALPIAARRAGIALEEPRLGIVHGQMPARERDAAMEAFRRGEIGVLVGTTVVEVGVDVPEATVIVILNADRFGVAQLHQLRGRVGRGEWQSWCVLVSDEADEVARARLAAVAATQDGFVLAEEDLRLRRAGDLLGVQQSGLPPLRVARLDGEADRGLVTVAREEALGIVDGEGRLRPGLDALRAELASGWLRTVGAGEALPEEGEPAADATPVIAARGTKAGIGAAGRRAGAADGRGTAGAPGGGAAADDRGAADDRDAGGGTRRTPGRRRPRGGPDA